MSILHYDTETTGLFLKGIPSDDPGQPKMLSLSAILDDDNGNTRGVMSMLVRPEGWKIDERMKGDDGKPTAFAINGISNAIANKYGRPLGQVMSEFALMAKYADVFCAFSHHFDFKFIKISCAQLGKPGDVLRKYFETKSAICTMESAAKHLNGPTQRFIKLQVAFNKLHGRDFGGAHNSLADANASRMVYAKLKELKALPEPKSLEAREYDTPPPGKTGATAEVDF